MGAARKWLSKFLAGASLTGLYVTQRFQRWRKAQPFRIGIVTGEYFHKDLHGFGGYGMTCKNITDMYQASNDGQDVDVLLTKNKKGTGSLLSAKYHNTTVLFDFGGFANPWRNATALFRYGVGLSRRRLRGLVTIEYQPAYESFLLTLPAVPIVVWIHDPRPARDWERIVSVELEAKIIKAVLRIKDTPGIVRQSEASRDSLQKVLRLSKVLRRPVIFGHTAHCLVTKARELYGLPAMRSHFLPTPVQTPGIVEKRSERPSVCFLGRLDPVKRPWIFWELAKRFRSVDFLVAGEPHFPDVMNPIIARYRDITNLRFLGFVEGQAKTTLLQRCWAVVNTSIHEALPVSFLEAFVNGTPVISCNDPDGLVTKYGKYTGQGRGDGLDQETLARFEEAIDSLLSDEDGRKAKGDTAREDISARYSFETFKRSLHAALSA